MPQISLGDYTNFDGVTATNLFFLDMKSPPAPLMRLEASLCRKQQFPYALPLRRPAGEMMSALLSKNFWRGFVSGAVVLATVYVVHLVQKAPPVHPETCPETGHIPSDLEYLWAAYNNRNISRDPKKELSFDQVINGWLHRQKRQFNSEALQEEDKNVVYAAVLRGKTDHITRKTGPFLTFVTISGWSSLDIDRCLNDRNWVGD